MKRILAISAILLGLLAPARAQYPWVVLAITNADPANARVNFSGAMQRRAAYELNLYFRSSVSNALNITNRTIELSWKPTALVQSAPLMVVTGEVVSATTGQARVYLAKDKLNQYGDLLFQAIAYDTTNRASFFWQATVYDSLDHSAETIYSP
jgi:hypothetical protein